jgi:hypothetical protein
MDINEFDVERGIADVIEDTRSTLEQSDEATGDVLATTSEDAEKAACALRLCMPFPPRQPDQAVDWLNNKHFVVLEGGKTVVMTEEIDPEMDRRVLRRSSFGDFKNLYCNQYVEVPKDGEPTRVDLGSFWVRHPRRRGYRGIVFMPNKTVPDYYNLWRGFKVRPCKGDWSLMQDHIEEIICANNPELCEYILGWLAFAVQRPDQLPEVALVLRGKQGTGKGIFARGFGTNRSALSALGDDAFVGR